MGVTCRVPELRFKEFSGEWEEKKLGSFFSFKNGINASKEQYGHGYKFINVLDIINNNTIRHKDIIGSVDVSKEIFEKNTVAYGDILFQRSSETRAEAGQTNVYLDKNEFATFGGFVIRGQQKKQNYNPLFLNYMFKTNHSRKEITSKSNGSTRYNVGQETLSNVLVYLPKLKQEQEKIASFLSSVDSRIEQLTKKEQLLHEYKKGVLQKIFSQELRFKDDDGSEFPEWVEKRLASLCNIKKGSQLNKDTLTKKGSYPALNGGISLSGYTTDYNVEANTITISEGGNSCGYVNFLRTRFWSGGHNYSLQELKKFIIVEYLYQYLKFSELQIMRLRVGSGLPNIQKGDMANFKIEVPPLKEQTKIANFLSSLDTKIEQVTKELNLTKAFKKALLQKMFV